VASSSEVPELIGLAYPPAAAARMAAGDATGALSLLRAMVEVPNIRGNGYYAVHLPSVVRTAAASGDVELAGAFTDGFEAATPLAAHALAAAEAALTEARGDLEPAADRYADAATRWTSFGVAPERALALLGAGRCAVAIGRAGDAVEALRPCRSVCLELEMAPAMREADDLLARATALTS
jgi:hypothetical protein